MKRGFFKKLMLTLTALVLLMAFNVTAFAADSYTSGYWTYEFGSNGLTITSYSGSASTVTIPTTLDGYKVGAIGRQAFYGNTTMKTLTIPEGITSIGSEAFMNCYALSQINFNAKNCTIPDIWRYDSNKGVGVFSGAGSAATSLNVKFGSAVADIPKGLFNTDYENGYGYAHVTSITFSSGNKTIGEYAFADCRDLKKVTFGDNITTIGQYAFHDNVSLATITFNDELATIGTGAFEDCTNLTEITWGSGLDTIGNYAFKGCSSLKAAKIPSPTSVIGIQAFAGNTSLTTVTIPKSVTTIGAEAFYNTIKLGQINFNAENCTIPDIWRYDTNKGVGVFSGAGSAANSLNVTFGSAVADIPKGLFNTDYENAYGYAHVTSVTFSSGNKTIGEYAFADCRDLKEVVFGKNITTIGQYAFHDNVSLETITFKKALATIGTGAFEDCTNLAEITWGSGLDTIGNYAFKGCTSLKTAKIPYPTTVIGVQAFANNTSLTALTIPTTVTSIGAEAFYNTTKLAKINFNAKDCFIPDIWRYDSNKGVGVFSGAGSGTSSLEVVFGSKVTKVPANLFNTDSENGYDYAYITTVTMPGNVKEVGAYAFDDCIRLKTVTCKRGNQTIAETAYSDCPASMKFICYYGSTTETFAKAGNYSYSYLKPVKPVLGKATNTSNGIKITWNKALGASRYYIYRKTGSSGSWTRLDYVKASSGKLYFVDDEAKAGKVYYYTVKAYAPGNLWSSYNTTGLKIERLKAPQSVTLTNKQSGIYVKWNKSTGAEKYLVYRKKGSGNFIKVATTENAYYYDKTATVNGTKYQYKVYAYDSGSQSAVSATKVLYRLKQGDLTSVASNAAGKLTVKWAKNAAATGYQIQYSTNSSFSNAKTVKVTSNATVSKTISGLTKNKRYYVRVRAYKTVSGTSYYSMWSSSMNKVTKK